jgi:transcriptional regulator with XRE-family HTH domain
MGLKERLEDLMVEHELSRNQLAAGSGVPYTTIVGFWEKGDENVKLSTLRRLASFFRCTLDDLVGETVMPVVVDQEDEKELIRLYRHAKPRRKSLAVEILADEEG